MKQIKNVLWGIVCLALYLAMVCQPVFGAECDHTYVEREEPATCTKPGVRYYECSKCGDQYGFENTDPLGHDYGDWTTSQEPGCEAEGEQTRICQRCGYKESRVVEATGHNYGSTVVEPECDSQGYTRHTCNVCGDTYKTDYVDPLGHDYTTRVVEATCEKDGYTERVCSRCGDAVKSDYVDALGHMYVVSQVVEPTCEKDGYTLEECQRCGGSRKTDSVSALGHQYSQMVVEPDCDSQGYTRHTCDICGDSYKTDYTEALGHDFTARIVEPTCLKEGYTLLTCNRCGQRNKIDYTDLVDHRYGEEVVLPTCTKDGYTLHQCEFCGTSYQDDLQVKLGHDFDEGVVTKEATSTAMGRRTYTCRRCGETKTETTPKLVNPFVDVKKKDYFFDSVLWAVDQGITVGVDEIHFGPDDTCTRAQVVTFLWRAKGCPEPQGEAWAFWDVPQNSYYYKAVLWATEQGITAGTGPGMFDPEMACTREQVVSFLYRAAGCPQTSGANPFSDVKPGDYFWDSVLWASQQGITAGVDGGRFGTGTVCIRAQIVSFLYRGRNLT